MQSLKSENNYQPFFLYFNPFLKCKQKKIFFVYFLTVFSLFLMFFRKVFFLILLRILFKNNINSINN